MTLAHGRTRRRGTFNFLAGHVFMPIELGVKKLMLILVLLCAGAAAEVAPPEFYAPNEELRAYLLEAGEKHPKLRALHEEWLAALEKVPQVTSLEDPMLGFSYFLQSDDSRYSVMLSQMFPWFGTLRERGNKARAEADAALARLYAARNEIFAGVKKAYFEYAYLAESVRVTESQVDILTYMEGVVNSRYGLGMSGQEDLLRIQIEQTKLQDRYDGLMQYRPALAAQLNAAVGREAAADPEWPQPAPLPPEAPPAPIVMARLRVTNPELTEAAHLIEGSEREVELARKMGYPNFTFSLEYLDMKDVRNPYRTGPFLETLDAFRTWTTPVRVDLPPLPNLNDTLAGQFETAATGIRSLREQTQPDNLGGLMGMNSLVELEEAYDNAKRKDEVMLSVNVNVPIWRKRIKAGIDEAKHRVAAAEHERQRRAISLDAQARMALFDMQDGRRRYQLFDQTLIPQAQQTYEALQTSYASGGTETDFLDVLDSIQTLLDFELEKVQAGRDLQLAAAELEWIMGGPWASESAVPVADESTKPSADATPERLP
ncbi:MAG: TolC family protein [Candidatus Hydrogenedentes bacterium]|nr:TolC family protein [Candidatus Hydrogenedentota bacterium]